jgi:hypothetical protein
VVIREPAPKFIELLYDGDEKCGDVLGLGLASEVTGGVWAVDIRGSGRDRKEYM